MREDYIPLRGSNLKIWEQQFKTIVVANGASFGLTPQEIAEVVTSVDEHNSSYSEMISLKASAKAAVTKNKLNKKKALEVIRRVSKRIKSHSSYTNAIGASLGIIGPDTFENLVEVKPRLKAVLSGTRVLIKYPKKRLDGIELYSDRGNGFETLGIDTNSPYIDEREKLDASKPEERSYKAIYIYKDKKVGQLSIVISIIVP